MPGTICPAAPRLPLNSESSFFIGFTSHVNSVLLTQHSGSATAAAAVVAIPAVSVLPQYKYAVGVCNPQQRLNVKPQVTMQQPAVNVQGQEPVTTSMLASAPPQIQKQIWVNASF